MRPSEHLSSFDTSKEESIEKTDKVGVAFHISGGGKSEIAHAVREAVEKITLKNAQEVLTITPRKSLTEQLKAGEKIGENNSDIMD